MAKPRFSLSDLSSQSAQVKRTIISRAKKGFYLDEKLSKTKVLKQIATRLKLSSHRSFYDGSDREDYLNDWFDKLLAEIKEINNGLSDSEVLKGPSNFRNMEELLVELENEKKLRQAYETRVRKLMEENEKLRTRSLNLFKDIDNA